MIKTWLSVFLLFGFVATGLAQGELDEEKKIFFRDESTFAAMITTNGFGGNYRYARRQDAFRNTLYDFDFVRLKNEKEKKLRNQNANNIVYGQMSSFSSLRSGIGFEKEIFSKQDKGSVGIRYFYTGGLSLGLEKPVYYRSVNESDSGQYFRFSVEQHRDAQTLGAKAPLYVGLNEIKVVPGAFLKAGFSFEYSDKDKIVNALEGAFVIDIFYRPVEIMYTHKNMIFASFVLAYRFGKAIDKKQIRSNRRIDNIVNFD